jgi:hypothetical protein
LYKTAAPNGVAVFIGKRSKIQSVKLKATDNQICISFSFLMDPFYFFRIKESILNQRHKKFYKRHKTAYYNP